MGGRELRRTYVMVTTVTAAISLPSSLTSMNKSCVAWEITSGRFLDIGSKTLDGAKAGPRPRLESGGIRSRLSRREKRGRKRYTILLRP